MKVLEWILFVGVFAGIVSVISRLDLMSYISSARHFLTEYWVVLIAGSAVLIAVRVVSSPPHTR
jgi:hypothetical protein